MAESRVRRVTTLEMASALRIFSRRKISPKWFCKTSSTSPLVLHHVKDYTGPCLTDSSLLLARSFHRQVFFEDGKKMSFGQPLGASSGVFLCRHISSSSSSCKPEEWSIKIDAFGDIVEGLVPEKSVEAMSTTIDGCSSAAAVENFSSPVNCVHYLHHSLTYDEGQEAVYIYLITDRISLYILSMCKSLFSSLSHTVFLVQSKTLDSFLCTQIACRDKQVAKLRKALGMPYDPAVTASEQQRIMARVISAMTTIDVVKKKDNK
ncbi:unnamed protein product [Brassica oleracea var. botrytis]